MEHKQDLSIKEIEDELNEYIKRLLRIKWFQPELSLKRSEVDEHVYNLLRPFGVRASIEYRRLNNIEEGINTYTTIRESSWLALRENVNSEAYKAIEKANLGELYINFFRQIWHIGQRFSIRINEDVLFGKKTLLKDTRKGRFTNVLKSLYYMSREAILGDDYKADKYEIIDFIAGSIESDLKLALADIIAQYSDTYLAKYPNGNFVNLIYLWEAGLYPIGMVNGKFVIYAPSVEGEFPEKLFY